MKKLLYIFAITIVAISCKKTETKDYVTLSGKIENRVTDTLKIFGGTSLTKPIKTIVLKSDGSFEDTLHIETDTYSFHDGQRIKDIYLKKGRDLGIFYDNENFNETINFTGDIVNENFYLNEAYNLSVENMLSDSIYDLDKEDFINARNSETKLFKDLLSKFENLDTTFVEIQLEGLKQVELWHNEMYNKRQSIVGLDGKASPKFNEYLSSTGNFVSLDDLKGSYVYIDIWATWCVPCKKEIPYLEAIQEKYHNKNIKFVSISNDKKEDKDKWKKMVEEMSLAGIQLFANGDESFLQAYTVYYIPRFILLDPAGVVIKSDAPRPSDEELIILLNSLLS